MQTEDKKFLATLKQQAKDQALLQNTSPLPDWMKPVASIVGLHYWQFLLVVSFVLGVFISVWYFPVVYEKTQNTQKTDTSEYQKI